MGALNSRLDRRAQIANICGGNRSRHLLESTHADKTHRSFVGCDIVGIGTIGLWRIIDKPRSGLSHERPRRSNIPISAVFAGQRYSLGHSIRIAVPKTFTEHSTIDRRANSGINNGTLR